KPSSRKHGRVHPALYSGSTEISAEWPRSLGVRVSDRLVTGAQYHGDKEEGEEDEKQGGVEKGEEGSEEKENRREGFREEGGRETQSEEDCARQGGSRGTGGLPAQRAGWHYRRAVG